MSVTNIHIYQNTLSGRCYNAKGATFGEYEPSVSYKSTFRLWWHLVTSDEGSDTETVNVANWTKANLAGCSARLTCDNDFIHRISGKLKTAITAETAFSQIILTVSGADHTNIPSNGMITITSASGKNFDFEYSSLTIDGTTVTCDLGGEVTISENLAENATAKISQEVLFQSDNNAELSAPENGLFVFDCVAYSNKLINAQETANSRFIDVMGIECLPFIVTEDGVVQEMPSYICETFKVSVNMGEAGSNPQLTPAEKNNAALIVQNLISQGMSVELYNSTTDTWEPYSDSVTYTTAYTKYRFWLTSAGESSTKSEVPLLNGIDGVTPVIGANGNWFTGEEDTGKRAVPHDAKAQYSLDGANWKENYSSGDKYIRFSTDNGVTWASAINILGNNAPRVQIQYSSDASTWRDIQQTGDMYIRFSVDGGTQWTGAMQSVAFPVKFRYCATSNGTFHADYLATDKYMQHSVDNGVTWSASIRMMGQDGQSFVPNATGTLAERSQYDSAEKGFAYLVTSGETEGFIYFRTEETEGVWSDGMKFTPAGLQIQFSITGSEWHDTATEEDIYIRFSVDGGTQWTTAARCQGKSAYVYWAYASDISGNDFTLTFDRTLHYRNEIHTFNYYLEGDLTAERFNEEGIGWYQYAGTDGKTYEWLEGTATPDNSIGESGDWYVQKDTCDMFRKEGNEWRFVLNFRGKIGAGVTPKGFWDATAHYTVNDMVTYNGNAYYALQANTNIVPEGNADCWQLYVSKGDKGDPGASLEANYIDVYAQGGYIVIPNDNMPVKVEINNVGYDIDTCPVVDDGANFELDVSYFLAKANLASYSGVYRVWRAGGKEGLNGSDGKDGKSFAIDDQGTTEERLNYPAPADGGKTTVVYYDNDFQMVFNGTWDGSAWVWGEPIQLKGDKGDPGATPTITNKYWYINGENTGVKAQGEDGKDGEDGLPNTLTIGTVSTGEEGTQADATITGDAPNQTLNLTIPRGDKGDPNTLTIGTVSTGEEGTQADATITGDAPNQTLNLTIPRGDKGVPNTLTIGIVDTGVAGSDASATITGDAPNQVLNLTIPRGDRGAAFTVNESGLLANLSQYDSAATGFTYLATDTGDIYIKQSATAGDWSDPVPFKGDPGRGVSRITKTATAGLVDTYTVYYSDDTTNAITVTNGSGVESVTKTSTTGLVDTYTIAYQNGESDTFDVTNGKDGNSITGVSKVSTDGLVDTYQVAYTEQEPDTFDVTNGKDGTDTHVLCICQHSPDALFDGMIWIKGGTDTPKYVTAVGGVEVLTEEPTDVTSLANGTFIITNTEE